MDPSDDRLRWARVRWRSAGDRLFPVTMIDEDGYTRALQLVGLLLGELRRSARTVAELLALDADPAPLLAVLPAERRGGAMPLDDTVLVQAACGVYSVELLAALERDRRHEVIEDARASGAGWVVLEGSPDAEHPGHDDSGGGPAGAAPSGGAHSGGARFAEMHVRTGRTLVTSVDPYSGGAAFSLEEITLDRRTGDPVGEPATRRQRSFASRPELLAERGRWRAEIDAAPEG